VLERTRSDEHGEIEATRIQCRDSARVRFINKPHDHERGWKDTLRLDSGDEVRVIMRFDGYRGRYLMHCHNLEHEDYDMMMRFDVV